MADPVGVRRLTDQEGQRLQKTLFQRGERCGRRRIDVVVGLVAAGHTHPGMLPNLAEVSRPDGSRPRADAVAVIDTSGLTHSS
jgi:hypothetical protein